MNTINFSTWSIQYQCFCIAIPVFFLSSMKELTPIIKLGSYGVLAVLVYGVFIIYIFITAVVNPDFQQNWDTKMELFTTNFSAVAGTFSLAFFVHNVVCQMMNNNAVQEMNQRDLFLGYLNVYVIYGIVGLFGSIGILINLDPSKSYSTISQFFTRRDQPALTIPAQIVNLLFLFQLSTVLPILCFISRTQFYSICFGTTHRITKLQNLAYNLAFLVQCLLFQILVVNPSVLIGVAGAVCGFYIVYILPFAIRISASHHAKSKANFTSAFSEGDGNFKQSNVSNSEQISSSDPADARLLLDNPDSEDVTFSGKVGGPLRLLEGTLWVLIVLIGILMAVLQLLGIFGVSF